MKKAIKELIKDILIALAIVLVLTIFIKPTIVKEHSMVPTLQPEDYLIMSRQAFTIGNMERGNIVIFQSDIYDVETGKKKLLIKRAIALPGDKIKISGGKVYINEKEQNEPYLKDNYTRGDIAETTIPEGKIFVMGDNREVSLDSRSNQIGLVDLDKVKGEAVFRLWPLKEFGILK